MSTEANSGVKVQIQDQDSIKLDRFDGTNYTRWVDKMVFLLTTLNLFYALDFDLQPIPNPKEDDSPEAKLAVDKAKRDADELKCGGYILNSLTNRLYDLHRNLKTPKRFGLLSK